MATSVATPSQPGHNISQNVEEVTGKHAPEDTGANEVEAGQQLANLSLTTGLFSLPAELRLRIYELVVVHTHDAGDEWVPTLELEGHAEDIDVTDLHKRYWVGYPPENPWVATNIEAHHRQDWRKQPALCQVSRRIRSEILPVYYGTNTFAVRASDGSWYGHETSHGTTLGANIAWFRVIGQANARLIKHTVIAGLHREQSPAAHRENIFQELKRCGVRIDEVVVTFNYTKINDDDF